MLWPAVGVCLNAQGRAQRPERLNRVGKEEVERQFDVITGIQITQNLTDNIHLKFYSKFNKTPLKYLKKGTILFPFQHSRENRL